MFRRSPSNVNLLNDNKISRLNEEFVVTLMTKIDPPLFYLSTREPPKHIQEKKKIGKILLPQISVI